MWGEDNMSQPSGPVCAIEQPEGLSGQAGEWINRRATEQATRAANARQLSGRRRFVDPTTCEREYSEAEMEFMMAMNDYKRRSGRMFPTWSEVLEVLQGLGYEKVEPAVPIGNPERKGIVRPVPAAAGAVAH
jgi:hypothetical protein